MVKTLLSRLKKIAGVPANKAPEQGGDFPADVDPAFVEKFRFIRSHKLSMLGWERLYSAYQAVRHICNHHIAGDIVECGVWRGGCSWLMADALAACGDATREQYLYDTFAGMSLPDGNDISFHGQDATATFQKHQQESHNGWCYASLEDVKNTMTLSQLSNERIHFIKGKVEETLPKVVPEKIALLRLDTDLYASTYHEMIHLFPILVQGGVLIIDDYWWWQGSKKAVDQYLKEKKIALFFSRIECSAVGVKP